MDDIIAQSFETHGIWSWAVVVYSNVYIYALVIYMVKSKKNYYTSTYIVNE